MEEWTKVYEQRALEGTMLYHYVDKKPTGYEVVTELADPDNPEETLNFAIRYGLDTPKMMCENIEEIYERMGW